MQSNKKYTNPKRQIFGFTLTELIVVITILGILATIAFISIGNYISSSRDSVRVTDIASINKSLALSSINTGSYPTPSKTTDITLKGGKVWTQGIFDDGSARITKLLSKAPIDPKFSVYYSYSLSSSKKEYELACLLEGDGATGYNNPIIDRAYADSTTYTAYVKSGYNQMLGTSYSGSSCTPFFLPSIVLGSIPNNGALENANSGSLVFPGQKNLPDVYSGAIQIPTTGYYFSVDYNTGTTDFTLSGVTCGSKITQSDAANLAGRIQQILHNSPVASLPQYASFVAIADSGTLLQAGTTMAKTILSSTVDSSSPAPSFDCAPQPTIPNSGVFHTGNPTTFYQAWQYDSSAGGACQFNCASGFVYNSLTNECTTQLCSGSLPLHAQIIGPQNVGVALTHNTDSSVSCAFDCASGYDYNSGTNTCVAQNCATQTKTVATHSYTLPVINDGASHTGTATVPTADAKGTITYSQGFSCSLGTLSLDGSEVPSAPVCDTGYTASGSSCVANNCAATTLSGYALTLSADGSTQHPTKTGALINGTLILTKPYTCTLGSWVAGAETTQSQSCNLNYTLSAGPTCTANTQVVSCGGTLPANTTASTSTNYTQTWNGTNWGTSYSWTQGASTCGYTCSSGYTWNSGTSSCQVTGCSAQTIVQNSHSYTLPAIANGSNYTGNVTIPTSDGHGTMAYSQDFSCASGAFSANGSESGPTPSCNTGYHTNCTSWGEGEGEVCALYNCIKDIVVSTFAGNGTAGYQDATGTSAMFNAPYGIVRDTSGNIFVADTGNNRIRKITPAGVVSTFAGNGTAGYQDATGTSAMFYTPTGLAIDSSNNIYVVDLNNYKIRKITPAGVVSTLAGSSYGYADGTSGSAKFKEIYGGIAVDSSGNVYAADTGNAKVRKITPAGVVSTLVSGDAINGLLNLHGIAISPVDGNIYVGSSYYVGTIAQISPSGTVLASQWRSFQTGQNITSLTFDSLGNPYYTIFNYAAGAGNGYAGYQDGLSDQAMFNSPNGLLIDPSGAVYVADTSNNRIRKITF